MNQEVFGQHVGRDERTRQSQSWLGASLVQPTPDGNDVIPPPANSMEQLVAEIRENLAHHARVSVVVKTQQAVDELSAALTDDEFDRIDFGN